MAYVSSATVSLSSSILYVENLKVWHPVKKLFSIIGYVRAVDGVTLDVKPREVLSIVGESGCGKTTLARAILGLVPITSGKVIFEGIDITEKLRKPTYAFRKQYSSKIGYVQQDPYSAVPPFMNIKNILEEPLRIHKIPKRERLTRILNVLSEVGLTPPEEFLHKYPHMISGGQLQRVAIARSLILEPKIVIADEPVSMLDASIRIDVLTLFNKLREKHDLSIIYITHDLATAKYFSNRIAIMYAGQIVEVGKARDVIYKPKHPYTESLLEAIPDPDPQNRFVFRKVLPGEPPNLINPPTGCRLSPRCPHAVSICKEKEPPYIKLSNDRYVKCWLYSR